jgi:hypothetical protein
MKQTLSTCLDSSSFVLLHEYGPWPHFAIYDLGEVFQASTRGGEWLTESLPSMLPGDETATSCARNTAAG